jgi:hypothetical protein
MESMGIPQEGVGPGCGHDITCHCCCARIGESHRWLEMELAASACVRCSRGSGAASSGSLCFLNVFMLSFILVLW